jgi:hypothetical protein
VGNPGRVSTWAVGLSGSSLDGDIRTVDFQNDGGTAHERIVEHDDAGRYYVYEYLDGPLPLASYRSRIAVSPSGGSSSLVTWNAEFTADNTDEERELAETISGIYTDSLVKLARRMAD